MRPLLVTVFAVVAVCRLSAVYGETFAECENAESGSFVASSTSCSAYIYCDGEDSVLGECEEGEYFDGTTCDSAENVYCPLDAVTEGNDETTASPAETEDTDPETPEQVVTETTNPAPTTTTATTTTATTTTATTATTPTTSTTPAPPATTGPPSVSNVAPVVRDTCPAEDDPNQIVFVPHNQSCSDYYVCYHGHPIEMHCVDHLHFNPLTGRCDFPENAKCRLKQPAAYKCLPHITDFFPHPTKCNYFYYCIKGFQTVQQCPFFYGWDVERRSCVHLSHAKCYNNIK